MDFNQTDLAKTLKSSSDQELNSATFGIVRLQPGGAVSFYNQYEADLAGIPASDALGKNFFTEIAPCTNNFMVANKYQTADESSANIDETIDYMFTYKLKPTNVTLRILIDGEDHWLCVKKA